MLPYWNFQCFCFILGILYFTRYLSIISKFLIGYVSLLCHLWTSSSVSFSNKVSSKEHSCFLLLGKKRHIFLYYYKSYSGINLKICVLFELFQGESIQSYRKSIWTQMQVSYIRWQEERGRVGRDVLKEKQRYKTEGSCNLMLK